MELCFINNEVCVYNRKDWEDLRRNHRIVGRYLGASQSIPTLPIALLPEESLLLLKRNVIKLAHYPKLAQPPSAADYDEYKRNRERLLEAERAIYRELRKEDLRQIVDKIVEGKLRKGIVVSREAVLDDELNKELVSGDTMIWPIETECSSSTRGASVAPPISAISRRTTPTRAAVFEDLWDRGYYVTCGKKFGGDFLVYSGDPVAFHAVYIVRCVDDVNKEMHPSEVVAFGRLGTAVKKKAVFASLNKDTIDYLTINWLDS